MLMSRNVTSLLIVMMGLTLSACAKKNDYGPMGSVTGKLTINGKVIEQGTQLLFMKMDAGYAAFGETDQEGNYSIIWARDGERKSKLPLGTYKVLIQPPRVGKDTEEMSAEEMLEGGDVAPAKPKFPVKYQQHSTSGLEYTIEEGKNQIDIDLNSK